MQFQNVYRKRWPQFEQVSQKYVPSDVVSEVEPSNFDKYYGYGTPVLILLLSFGR